jgi:hypothetical protein
VVTSEHCHLSWDKSLLRRYRPYSNLDQSLLPRPTKSGNSRLSKSGTLFKWSVMLDVEP